MTLDAGNVGIGTTSPSGKLNVIGDVHLGNYTDAANKSLELRTPSAILGITTSATAAVGTTISYSWVNGGQGPLKINNAGGEVMRIDTSGNVGIGTADPETKLHIFKGESGGAAANTQSGLTIENSTHTYLQFLTPATSESGILFGDTDNDSGAFTYSHNTDAMSFRTAASTKMTILSAGNVGIGTTSPSAKLDIYHTTADTSINVNTGTGGTYPKKTGISFGATSTSLAGEQDFKGGAGIQAINTAASGNPTDLLFWTNSAGTPAERMRINAAGNTSIAGTLAVSGSGDSYFTGNLGIGVTNPSARLTVQTAPDAQAINIIGRSDGLGYLQFFAANGTTVNGSINGGSSGLGFTGSASFSDTLAVSGSGDSYFTGDLGIGTTSPGAKLEVKNTGADSGIIAKFVRSINAVDEYAYITVGNASPAYFGNLQKSDDVAYISRAADPSGGNGLFVQASGNVGIGTTSPSQKLHVTGNARVTGAYYDSLNSPGSNGQVLSSTGNGTTTDWITPASGGTIGGTATNNQVAVGSGSNTIDGSSSFTWTQALGDEVLTVGNGAGSVNQKSIVINKDTNGRGNLLFESGGTSAGHLRLNGSTNILELHNVTNISIDTDGTSDIILAPGGQVGINNTSPTADLHVTGTGIFSSTVTASNFILSSDERLKENIKDLDPKRIDTNWKSFNIKDSDEGYRVGVIAQELEVNHPEFVETNDEGYKSVKYIDLLISKIAELEDRIKKLEK